jgi:hypothetical protein
LLPLPRGDTPESFLASALSFEQDAPKVLSPKILARKEKLIDAEIGGPLGGLRGV